MTQHPLPTSDREAIAAICSVLVEHGAHITEASNVLESLANPSAHDALETVVACDEGVVRFARGDDRLTVFFVLGNAPDEVAADYWPADSALAAPMDALTGRWGDEAGAIYWASPAGKIHLRSLLRFC